MFRKRGGGTVHWREDNFVIFFLSISLLFCIDIRYLGMWGLVLLCFGPTLPGSPKIWRFYENSRHEISKTGVCPKFPFFYVRSFFCKQSQVFFFQQQLCLRENAKKLRRTSEKRLNFLHFDQGDYQKNAVFDTFFWISRYFTSFWQFWC